MLENFKDAVKECGDNKETIIGFISTINAKLLLLLGTQDNEFTVEQRDEILDLYDEFYLHYLKRYEHAIKQNWPDDPLFLRVSVQLDEEEYQEQTKNEIDDKLEKVLPKLTEQQKASANELVGRITGINKKRELTAVYSNNTAETVSLQKDIPDMYAETCRKTVLYVIAKLLINGGGLTIRVVVSKSKANVFGIRFTKGDWEPVSADEMKWAHTHDPRGKYIGEEKGVTYKELHRLS